MHVYYLFFARCINMMISILLLTRLPIKRYSLCRLIATATRQAEFEREREKFSKMIRWSYTLYRSILLKTNVTTTSNDKKTIILNENPNYQKKRHRTKCALSRQLFCILVVELLRWPNERIDHSSHIQPANIQNK